MSTLLAPRPPTVVGAATNPTVAQLPWGPVLGGTGAFCVTPGNSENAPEGLAGINGKWLALNVIDQPADQWDLVRQRCTRFGLTVYPWGRLHREDSQMIICQTAKLWKTRPLLNIEDEAKQPGYPGSQPWGQPKVVAAQIKALFPKIQPILSIPGWPYWGGTDWRPLADFPALLQILWEDMRINPVTKEEIARVQRDCEYMAKKVFKRVGVSYQSFHDSSPLLYDRNRKGWSIIWGDTVSDWPAWGRL